MVQMVQATEYIKPYTGPWTEKQLRHLLRRTLFGFSRADVSFFNGLNREVCVKILLKPDPVPEPLKNYFFSDDKAVPEGEPIVSAPKGEGTIEEDRIINLKAWWLRLMLFQPRTITEKMTLFWHNHFAVQFKMVNDSRYAYRYLDLLHKNALGNFKTLLRGITTDPCMLVFLNGNENNKAAPNENYARELQELFTVGKGANSHYTEGDVKAAAKVLSGWKEDNKQILSYFNAEAHSTEDKKFSSFYGERTIAGRSGNDGALETDGLMKMICEQKEVSRFLCRKLYRWFIDSNIDEDIENNFISPLADIMIQSDYEMVPVLEAMFSSSLFFEPRFMGAMIKSHIDFTVGVLKGFNVEFPSKQTDLFYQTVPFIYWFAQIGQDIGDPPSVAGWPAYYEYPTFYKNWVDSETLAQRLKLMKYLTYPEDLASRIEIDFPIFINTLPAPDNPKRVISDCVDSFFGAPPGPSQLSYLEKLLADENGTGEPWSAMWANYIADSANKEPCQKVLTRLKKVFDVFFAFPEFQLM